MKTPLLLLGTVLAPLLVCDPHDAAKSAANGCPASPEAASAQATCEKSTAPAAPAKPEPRPAGQERGTRPPRPSYLFL